MWSDKLSVLLYIASKLDSITDCFEASTIKISQEVKVSQQTVSRKLRELEESGLITRELTGNGVRLCLTSRARTILKRQRQVLDQFFEKNSEVKGVVTSGLGQGRYYMSQKGYTRQFVAKLGYKPYAGTLNVKVSRVEIEPLLQHEIIIGGFSTKERSFGGLIAYPISVNGIKCHVIFPKRTSHKDTAEIISPSNLREELDLKDGDEVRLS